MDPLHLVVLCTLVLTAASVLTVDAWGAGKALRRRPLRIVVDRVTGSTRRVPQEPSPEERAAFERHVAAAAAAWATLLCLLVQAAVS